jgi:molecular chaperone GrpE
MPWGGGRRPELASAFEWLYCPSAVAEESKDSPDTMSSHADAAVSEPPEGSEPKTASSSPDRTSGDGGSAGEAVPGGSEAAEADSAASPQPAPATAPPNAEQAGSQEAEAEPEIAPADPIEIAEAEAARWKDKCLRTAADFDNFRKRSRRDVDEAGRRGGEDLLRELLPVFDNLERAASHAETATDVQSLADGIRMVMRQFTDTLVKLGVERVPSVGEAFDPAVHEAIQHMATEEHPPGTVAAEVQAGYRRSERLVRPALVVVAKAPESPAEKLE